MNKDVLAEVRPTAPWKGYRNRARAIRSSRGPDFGLGVCHAGLGTERRRTAPRETNGFPRRYCSGYRLGKGKMAEDVITTTGIARHGASRLPSVEVDSFNIELKDDDGFLGDRASKGAFRKILDTVSYTHLTLPTIYSV